MAINMTTEVSASTLSEQCDLEARLSRLDHLINSLEDPTNFLRARLDKLYGAQPKNALEKDAVPNIYSYFSQFDDMLNRLEHYISILDDEVHRLENF